MNYTKQIQFILYKPD